MVICLEWGADLHMICPSWCHCHSLSLASVKSRLVLPFWYRLTWTVPEKTAVKRVCVCVWFVIKLHHSTADTWKYCGFDETSVEFGPQADYASLVIFRQRAISDSTCDKNGSHFKDGHHRLFVILWYCRLKTILGVWMFFLCIINHTLVLLSTQQLKWQIITSFS